MKFTIYKASACTYHETKEFKTLEDLREFQLECERSLVINFDRNEIIIYDDYLE
jgi:hypothetical protein